jgi:hypothetical protein
VGFSRIPAHGEIGDIEAAVHRHINVRLARFIEDYRAHWTRDIRLCDEDALTSFESVLAAVNATPYKLYLLIDEYDNFANEVLMADRPGSRDRYQTLLQGEGLFKSVFKAVKAGAGGLGVDRVFITGVSPVVLSDMTSGYNVGKDIYLEPEFNDLCGFTEAEVTAVLEQLAPADGAWSVEGRWRPCAPSTTAIGSARRRARASTTRR